MASTSMTGDYRSDLSAEAQDDASQIRREIEHTRQEMDETLDELGERLTFQHMADSAMDYVKATSARTTAQASAKLRAAAGDVGEKIKQLPAAAAAVGVGLGAVSARMGVSGEGLRCTANQVTHQVSNTIRQHPVSTALVGAGLLCWAYERMREGQPSRTGNRTRIARWRAGGEEYGATYGGMTGRALPAWHRDYDWSQAEEDEARWSSRARSALDSIQTTLSDASRSAMDKLRSASTSLMGLCGYSNDQIRARMHSQWADLEEHSGSFVDARTGEPYDSSYGTEWRSLSGVQNLAETGEDESRWASWSEKASQLVDDLKHSLSNTGDNVRDTLQTMSTKIGEFGNSIGGATTRAGSRAAESASEAWQRAASGTRRMGRRAKEFGSHAGEKIGHGYQASRDELVHQIDEHPFAAAGAALGLGLLAGFLMPRSRMEDRFMGETADQLKDQAWEVAQRGREVVQATGLAAMEQVRDQAKDLAQDALDRGKEVVQSTGKVALDEAEQHGLSSQQATHQSGQRPKEHNQSAMHQQRQDKKEAESEGLGATCPTPTTAPSGKQSASISQQHSQQRKST
jgi:ElaB/YqjD/DUF883 family membrane-anchored ribosome-binding protein